MSEPIRTLTITVTTDGPVTGASVTHHPDLSKADLKAAIAEARAALKRHEEAFANG